jgi:low affinity Fe/Cu permease
MAKSVMMAESRNTNDRFARFASSTSDWLGSRWAFAGAGMAIVIWALVGPIFRFSDTWQLVINDILDGISDPNTQNRDARAINLKLNELIRAIDNARDHMSDIESLGDLELDLLQAKYEKIRLDCVERRERIRIPKKQSPLETTDLA